ncbi:alpha/beta hydrolase PoxA [Litoribacillus peritrichatus]|uniref:Alpha/beta hydrolase PoxA n=2 Tax=Litoribacillus peritrichatus TaxID=718191 RepID=A0ABP7MK13_9GAMM
MVVHNMISALEPWSFQVKPNLTLRGWRTEFTGKPILHFLHGNGFCGLTYAPLLKALLADFDLIITDLPGHGDSDMGGDFVGWNRCASMALKVVHHFVDNLPETELADGSKQKVPCYAVGHSFGGVITALMLAKDRNCFDQAILLDPVIFPPGMLKVMATADLFGLLQQLPLAKQARVRTRHWPTREDAFEYFYERGTFKGWQSECLQAYVDYALQEVQEGVGLKCPPKREAEIFSSYPKRLWPLLKQVRTPTNIWVAKKTFPFIARSMERLKKRPVFDIETLDGGHCFMQERPEEIAERIRQTLLG